MQPAVINIFEKAVKKAGKILLRDFGELENLQIQSKSVGDFVTNADIKVEKTLLETLKYYYPDYTYITEETGEIKGDENTIIIDPIDGTSNFIHGIPHVGIIVAKMTNDEITDGVIYNPILNEFFWSSKGKGSWCNNSRLRVSNRQIFSDCLIGTGLPFGERIYKSYLSEIDEKQKTVKILNLDDFSVEDLQNYISELQTEILRVQDEIKKKENLKLNAEKFFK